MNAGSLGRLLVGLVLVLCESVAALELECTATHPALVGGSPAGALPVETFFETRGDDWGFRVSPDGRKLLWLSLSDGVATPHVRSIEGGAVTVIPTRLAVNWAYWAPDSRHLLLWRDHRGNENYRPWLVDNERPADPARALVSGDDVRVFFQQQLRQPSQALLVRHNRRNAEIMDLYRIELESGAETLIEANPGRVDLWVTDGDGVPVLRRHREADYSWRLERADNGRWETLIRGAADDYLEPRGHPPPGATRVWALSNRGRDRVAVVQLDLRTGAETVYYEHPSVDVSGIWLDERHHLPIAAWVWPGYQHVEAFEPLAEQALAALPEGQPVAVELTSWSDDTQALIFTTRQDQTGQRHYLLERNAERLTELGHSRLSDVTQPLAEMKPIAYRSRDGLTLHGYLTLPRGERAGPLPSVVNVHGGPFSRDVWGYHSFDQLLANRGYAVLRVNYRGSTGYGRAFTEAARREFAGKMHDDLLDGVSWLVANGISDAAKVAIYGRSYGGYATLVGLTMTPRFFAAGIDVMGPAELAGLMQSGPPYWRLYRSRWLRFIGHPDDEQDRIDMAGRSPINYLHRIERPLLVAHGANDVRVTREHSDRIVSTLRKRGVEVDYLLFEGEGHSLRSRSNQIRLAQAAEAFLGRHLGGRICQPSSNINGVKRRANADT